MILLQPARTALFSGSITTAPFLAIQVQIHASAFTPLALTSLEPWPCHLLQELCSQVGWGMHLWFRGLCS